VSAGQRQAASGGGNGQAASGGGNGQAASGGGDGQAASGNGNGPLAEDERVGLDELLWAADEPPPEPRRRSAYGWLVKALVLCTAIAGGVTVLAGVAFEVDMPFATGFAALFCTVLVLRAVRAARPAPLPAALRLVLPPAPPSGRDEAGPDGLDAAVGRWNTRLEWGAQERGRFDEVARLRLVELVDERLRQRHGLTMSDDPVRARALLGHTLWTFLSAPVRRTPSPHEMAAIVAEVEHV
jgi:hypothetical protein